MKKVSKILKKNLPQNSGRFILVYVMKWLLDNVNLSNCIVYLYEIHSVGKISYID